MALAATFGVVRNTQERLLDPDWTQVWRRIAGDSGVIKDDLESHGFRDKSLFDRRQPQFLLGISWGLGDSAWVRVGISDPLVFDAHQSW